MQMGRGEKVRDPDGSDEDYIGEDGGSDEDYIVGEDGDSDESEDEETESNEFDKSVKKKNEKVGRPRGRKKHHQGRNRGVKPRKKKEEDDGYVGAKKRTRKGCRDVCGEKPRKKGRVSYHKGGDYDEDDMQMKKQMRREKSVKKPSLRRKNRQHGHSNLGEYTISEEEREQIREAREFCGRLASDPRSSTSFKMVNEDETVVTERKSRERKDKDMKMEAEVGKHVCGVCLSEAGYRSVRGIINCCSHYFCFSCIIKWSKVESRCPLCKQRFTTISRAGGGNISRDEVTPVPERDQVYQPSEEELRGYFDPYENAVCIECHQGLDDELMLLCDLCDSPSHTYCVGLGVEVPEGNWYCDGCRPAVVASSKVEANDNSGDASFCQETVRSPSPVGQHNLAVSGSGALTLHVGQHNLAVSGSGAFTLRERRQIQRHVLLSNRSRQSETSDGSGIRRLGFQHFGAAPLLNDGRSMSLTGQNVERQAHTSADQRVHPTTSKKEQVQARVRSHLKSLSRNMNLDYISFKSIARSSTHTILSVVGMEHRWNQVFPIQTRLLRCDHPQVGPVGGQCSSCFDWFVRNVVREVMSSQLPLRSKD